MNARHLLHAAAVSAACATPALAEPKRDFGELETGIQLSGRVGCGTWTDGDTATFFPGASGSAVGSVGPGTVYGAEVLYRTSPSFALGLGGAPEALTDAAYFRLMREVVTDFVQRFTGLGAAR